MLINKILKITVILALLLAELPYSVQAYEVAATPYDNRLKQCGVFGQPYEWLVAHSIPEASMQILFNEARSFRYVAEPDTDHWQTAEETSQKHSGDCEDKAIWLFNRLTKAGYSQLKLVIGKQREIDAQMHVWLTYEDSSGRIFLLDPTAQRKIWALSDLSEGWYQPIYAFDGLKRYRF